MNFEQNKCEEPKTECSTTSCVSFLTHTHTHTFGLILPFRGGRPPSLTFQSSAEFSMVEPIQVLATWVPGDHSLLHSWKRHDHDRCYPQTEVQHRAAPRGSFKSSPQELSLLTMAQETALWSSVKWTSGSEKRSARRTTPWHCVKRRRFVFKASSCYEKASVAGGMWHHLSRTLQLNSARSEKKRLYGGVVFRPSVVADNWTRDSCQQLQFSFPIRFSDWATQSGQTVP